MLVMMLNLLIGLAGMSSGTNWNDKDPTLLKGFTGV